jgi:hypothetical protein
MYFDDEPDEYRYTSSQLFHRWKETEEEFSSFKKEVASAIKPILKHIYSQRQPSTTAIFDMFVEDLAHLVDMNIKSFEPFVLENRK